MPKGPYITIELLPEEVEEILRTHFERSIRAWPVIDDVKVEFYPHYKTDLGEYNYTFKITPPDRYWK